MVFDGQPSKACHACRNRRKKCDRVETGCKQCARKGLPCPGFRDHLDLLFRDETHRVVLKAQRSSAFSRGSKQQTLKTPLHSQETTPQECCTLIRTLAEMPFAPAASPAYIIVEDVAISYFMCSYIRYSKFQHYLPDLYMQSPKIEDALSTALSATSLATFAIRRRDQSFMFKAQRYYSVALARTNAAISDHIIFSDHAGVALDRTLAAILLLGLFEVTFGGKTSPEQWATHNLGAFNLLQLRQNPQFRSRISIQILNHIYKNIHGSCFQRRVALPPELAVLRSATPHLDPKDPQAKLTPLVDKVIALRARVSDLSTSSEKSTFIHMQDARQLDRDAASLVEYFQQQVRLLTLTGQETTASQSPSPWVLRFPSAVLSLRLFLNEVIWQGATLTMTDENVQGGGTVLPYQIQDWSSLASLKEESLKNGEDIATQLLACVSCFEEPHPADFKFSPSARILGWPLSLVAKSAICSPASKVEARTVLSELTKDLYPPYLIEAATTGDLQPGIETWLYVQHID
ncbi:hypothetical protein V8C35DRAFT_318862 [Trichoderma chlorosporum]